jgi:hypothetical protein
MTDSFHILSNSLLVIIWSCEAIQLRVAYYVFKKLKIEIRSKIIFHPVKTSVHLYRITSYKYSVKVTLSLCLTNSALRHEGVWESGCIGPRFLLGNSWRWPVNFTPRPLYSWGKNSRYPLDRRLGGPQRTTWRKFLALPGLELRPIGRPAR